MDEKFSEVITLGTGKEVAVAETILRDWNSDIILQTVMGGHHADGAAISGEEIREASGRLDSNRA